MRKDIPETAEPSVSSALRELDRVHARLIAAVTPGHPGWISAKGPHSTAEDNDRYDALFSAWHSATRRCRALLGPNVHAEPNTQATLSPPKDPSPAASSEEGDEA